MLEMRKSLWVLIVVCLAAAPAAVAAEVVERSFAFDGGLLEIDTARGSVDVRTGNAGEVRVRIEASRGDVEDFVTVKFDESDGLRILAERYGIQAERVVAVGDATNDIPMLEAAGLGVAMGNAMEQTRAMADRVIGHNNSDAIAELMEELF